MSVKTNNWGETPIPWYMDMQTYERFQEIVGMLPHVDALGLDHFALVDELKSLDGYPLEFEEMPDGYFLQPVLKTRPAVIGRM